MDAVSKGQEMMNMPMIQLPPLAVDYAIHLCSRVDMCMEVLLTGWCVYCQIVEKLPCTDDLYLPDNDAIQWFGKHGYAYDGPVSQF